MVNHTHFTQKQTINLWTFLVSVNLFQVNFFEYLEVVYEALGRDGPDTNVALTTAFEDLEIMIAENRFEEIEGNFFGSKTIGREVMKYSCK